MRRSSGFSLLEAAVVLGVVGSVVAGIWAVSASTRASMQANALHQQTLSLVKNVRDYYAGRALPPAASAGDITATLRTGSILPEEMCPANCVDGTITNVYNSYGGVVEVRLNDATDPVTTFNVIYTGVPEKGCIQLGMMLSARSSDVGLTSYDVAGPRTTFPLSLSTLSADCASTGNIVDIIFRIRN